jgi:predicted metal-dependent phosphoesterase TrpH
MIIIPHPFDEMRRNSFYPGEGDKEFIDGIEVFNSRCILQKYNEIAGDYATKHNLLITAGSDAHFLNEIGNAGVIFETEDIREAIMKNDIKIFGNRTSLVNHGMTKVLKLWRKTKSCI